MISPGDVEFSCSEPTNCYMDLAYFSATEGHIYATEGYAVTTLQSDQIKKREAEGTEK